MGRPILYEQHTIAAIYKLRDVYNYGSLKISKILGMPRETVRYYLRKRGSLMNKVRFVILTYNRHDLMRKAIDSVLTGTLVPEVIIIDNTGKAGALSYVSDILYPNRQVHLLPMIESLGTSGSWNWAMDYFDDSFLIFANDDIEVHSNTIEELVNRALYSPAGLLYPSQKSGPPFSLFLLKHWAFLKVGVFDETFKPIYFEDNDYHYRLKLAAVEQEEVNVEYEHVGSATLNSMPTTEIDRHHIRFRWNEEYYRQKWGGLPGHETYTNPFNGTKDSIRWHRNRIWVMPDKYNTPVSTFIAEHNLGA